MRNLKKFLAVALALAMTLSLMVTASAAFTDADKIDSDYAESVAVLNGLGVFKGYTDGSFNPQGDITRAEVAAIIYRITTGDVEDKQAALYAGSAQFSDVPATEWYAGYVGFCANAGYVNGYEDGTFRPTGKVTGFEALAMVLRAIGYDAQDEFSGSKWQDNIAWVANKEGITEDVKPGVLVNYASRELVAEILFETLLVDTVYYMPATGYRTGDASLGEKVFELARFEGVLTANEYADLEGESALSSGKSIIDGVKYNYSSDLTQIGLSYQGYAAGKDVLFIEETGDNTVFETGAKVTLDGRFKKATGMYDDAEYFINFGNAYNGYYVSDWRIEYVLKGLEYDVDTTKYLTEDAQDDAAEAFFAGYGVKMADVTEVGTKYTAADLDVSMRPGTAIEETDMACIKLIFDEADKETTGGTFTLGEVYVGTKSTEDVSDKLSFKQFKNEYLEEDADLLTSVLANQNGNWLKVIDNDDDGEAEYVFHTRFTMTEVADITRKGDEIKLGGMSDYIDMDDVVTSDELEEGHVVLWTLIDGVYYIDVADVEVASVNKKGISTKNETITCGDTVYGQSRIDWVELGMDEEIVEAETQVSYDLYLDHFGYVRMYEESAYDNGFALLTDGYYETDKRDETYMAEIWSTESEDFEEVVVVDGKTGTAKDADNFIDSSTEKGDKEWKRLYSAEEVYAKVSSNFITNVAGYNAGDDGYTLIQIDVDDAISNKVDYDVIELTNLDEVTDKTLYTAAGNVQATTETVYYFVLTNASGSTIKEITSWVGYKNAPDAAVLADNAKAYAVTVPGLGAYDVAEVVVFESAAADSSALHFVYDYTKYDAITIGYDAEAEEYDTEMYVEVEDTDEDGQIYDQVSMIDFYTIWSDGEVKLIDEDYAAKYIYAGTVLTTDDVDNRDYVKVDVEGAKAKYFYENETTVYTIGKSSGDYYVELAEYEVEIGDKLIILTNKSGTIQYIINASQNADDDYAAEAAVAALWDEIAADAGAAEDNLYSVKVQGVEAELTGGKGTKADPFTYVATITTAKAAESGIPAIVVAADLTKDTVLVEGGNFGSGNVLATGTGSATWTEGADGLDAATSAYKWFVTVDGVYYTVVIEEDISASVLTITDYHWLDFTATQGDFYYAGGVGLDTSVVVLDDIDTVEFALKNGDTVVGTYTHNTAQVDYYVDAYGQYMTSNPAWWEFYMPGSLVISYLGQTEVTEADASFTRPAVFNQAGYPDLTISVVVTMEDGTVYTISE